MKICLIGSTRYRSDYEEATRELSRRGHLIFSVSAFTREGIDVGEIEKRRLDLLHLKKILESDAVVVVGKTTEGTPYLGESSLREAEWAALVGRAIAVWPDCLKNPAFGADIWARVAL
jgi:hypothetical protein